jgi:hypothetical protein
MARKKSDVIFAASVWSPAGASCETVITRAGHVYHTQRQGAGGPERAEQISRTRRDIDEFLWAVEDLDVASWERRCGPAKPAASEGWHMILETTGGLVRRHGTAEHPPGWNEVRRLLGEFLGRPFCPW